MEKWILGIVDDQTVECTVTYEVSSSRQRREFHPLLVSRDLSGLSGCLQVSMWVYWEANYVPACICKDECNFSNDIRKER